MVSEIFSKSNLPTCPYLTIFVRKSVGSTHVRVSQNTDKEFLGSILG